MAMGAFWFVLCDGPRGFGTDREACHGHWHPGVQDSSQTRGEVESEAMRDGWSRRRLHRSKVVHLCPICRTSLEANG